MTDSTPSLLESPPQAIDDVPVTEEAWDAWCGNGPAVAAESLRWQGNGCGYDTPAEVKEAWPECPGINWTEAENCDHAKHLLMHGEGGKEIHENLTYRAVLFMGSQVPDQTKDGWQLVGSGGLGDEVEVQVDAEGKDMRYTTVDGTLAVYECPTTFDCTITQCRPESLLKGADATRGEVLIFVGIDGTSTVENVLDGLEEILTKVWGDLPAGSDSAMAKAIQEAIASYRGYRFDEETGFDDEDLERIWDPELLKDNGEGPNVYVLFKPA